ncbi:MAG: hypothetical protein QN183_10085 [Armatimonadota bacterium]|nr:hypothetical protein [Armatimonadota bacterium]MDR7485816.1 hypothetical protein [Armatimonadota bacterium]MDR7532113.1 hypothetical protein [Armatimonadota bacterium]MDR7536702.1 hypothetical protein [Armatimonadota bacterium]
MPADPLVTRRWLVALGLGACVSLAVLAVQAGIACWRPSSREVERAVMAYVAQLTASWEWRSGREFARVATQAHTRMLEHPGMPARAIFSPYLQQARFERIEPRCRGAAVEMTVWTGYKPTFIVPQRVTLHLVHEGGRLKVAAVMGH